METMGTWKTDMLKLRRRRHSDTTATTGLKSEPIKTKTSTEPTGERVQKEWKGSKLLQRTQKAATAVKTATKPSRCGIFTPPMSSMSGTLFGRRPKSTPSSSTTPSEPTATSTKGTASRSSTSTRRPSVPSEVKTPVSTVDPRATKTPVSPSESFRKQVSGPTVDFSGDSYLTIEEAGEAKHQRSILGEGKPPVFLQFLTELASRSMYSIVESPLDDLAQSRRNTSISGNDRKHELITKIQDVLGFIINGYRGSNTLVPLDLWLPFAPSDTECLDLQGTNFCGQERCLQYLEEFVTPLKCLLLKGAVVPNSLPEIALSQRSLECISLRSCNVTDHQIWLCSETLTKLKVLDLLDCPLITPLCAPSLKKFPSLEAIGMSQHILDFWERRINAVPSRELLSATKKTLVDKHSKTELLDLLQKFDLRGTASLTKLQLAEILHPTLVECQDIAYILDRVKICTHYSSMNEHIRQYRSVDLSERAVDVHCGSPRDEEICETLQSIAEFCGSYMSRTSKEDLKGAVEIYRNPGKRISSQSHSYPVDAQHESSSCKNPQKVGERNEGEHCSGTNEEEGALESEAATVKQEAGSSPFVDGKNTSSSHIDKDLQALAESHAVPYDYGSAEMDPTTQLRELRSETSVSSVSRRLKFEDEDSSNGRHENLAQSSKTQPKSGDDERKRPKQEQKQTTRVWGKQTVHGRWSYSGKSNRLVLSAETENKIEVEDTEDLLALVYRPTLSNRSASAASSSMHTREFSMFSPPPSTSSIRSLKRQQVGNRAAHSPPEKNHSTAHSRDNECVKPSVEGISTPPRKKSSHGSTAFSKGSSCVPTSRDMMFTPHKRKPSDSRVPESLVSLEENWHKDYHAKDTTGKVWKLKGQKAYIYRQLQDLKNKVNNVHARRSPTSVKSEQESADNPPSSKKRRLGFTDLLKYRYDVLRPVLIELRPQVLASEEIPLREAYDEMYHVYSSAKKQLRSLGKIGTSSSS